MALINSNKVCPKNYTCSEIDGLRNAKNFLYHEAFEDGTIQYLEIIAVGLAIDKFQQLTIGHGFRLIQLYLKQLTEYCLNKLNQLKHYNDTSLVEIYRSLTNDYGPIITFNLKNSKGCLIFF